jgi:hypothetical protein
MNFRDYWLFVTGLALLLVISTIDNSVTYIKKQKHKHKHYSYTDSLKTDSINNKNYYIDYQQVIK